ncbi:MAG: helix-turn-helix transcriptional regulator [Clostridia bacterium]|nr:helix-turn-helix transcriptional regulator [Clostridia bacterium]
MIFHQPDNSQYNYSYNATIYRDINWPPHFHRNFEVICVLSGEVDCMINGRRGRLKAGEFGMCLSNEAHAYRSVGASTSWVGVFSGDFVHAFERQTKNKTGDGFRFVCGNELYEYLSAALLRPERPGLLTLKACLYALCAAYCDCIALSERTEKDDSAMRRIVDFVSDNYRSRITLADVADALGYDYAYTSRCFHKIFRLSFPDFLNGYRIEHALTLLNETEKSLAEIALESGFQSIRTFNDVFLKQLGRPPHTYRNPSRIKR